MSAPTSLIDPTLTGEYPVILSDALMGTTAKEVFTGLRYNHKPQEATPTQARLKPSVPGNTTSYDLSHTDDSGGKYTYSGARTTDESQYVLYFDAKKKAFVLDKVDSIFHLNLKTTPSEDTETLEHKFAQLDTNGDALPVGGPPSKAGSTKMAKGAVAKGAVKETKKAVTKKAAPKPVKEAKRKASSKKEKAAAAPLMLPTMLPEDPKPKTAESAPKPKPKSAKPKTAPGQFLDEDEEDEDMESCLTVEYPGADKRAPQPTLNAPAFLTANFSDFIKKQEEARLRGELEGGEADEDDGEFFDPSDDEGGEVVLASNDLYSRTYEADQMEEEDAEAEDEDEEEEEEEEEEVEEEVEVDDLAAEFEKQLNEEDLRQLSASADDDESDVSEAE